MGTTVLGILLGITISVNGLSPILNFYRDINCAKDAAGAYDCSFQENMKSDKCYHNGKEYAIGDNLPESELDEDTCTIDCTCRNSYPTDDAEWVCISIECPEHFARNINCIYTYNRTSCCSISSFCESENTKTSQPTCEYKGKNYYYGEKFYPEEESCMTCICGEGFNGTFTEPWCQEFSCNLYLHYQESIRKRCIPLYVKEESCCPIYEFRCPADDDQVITPKNVIISNSTTEAKCKFGKLELAVGQTLSPKTVAENCNVCTCEVPPIVSCVMTKCN